MSDTTLNRFLAQGTNAERVAFVPDPPTPASGPDPGYLFFETDTLTLWAWDDGGSAWEQIAASGIVNPMTTDQDIIVGGVGGTPDRLGVGSVSDVLSVGSGAVVDWEATTGTGPVVRQVSPSLTTPNIGVATGTSLSLTDGPVSNNIPQSIQSADYTLVLADRGTHIYHPSSDNNARVFTIPANGSVAFAIGTIITISNRAATACTIAITSDTLTWYPTGGVGTRTIAQYGKCAIEKVTSTEWELTGVGIT